MCAQWLGGVSDQPPFTHKSPKQFLLIAYLKTSGLNGSRELNANWALPLYPVSEDQSQVDETKNRPSEKMHERDTGLIYLLQIAFESN